ncbi:MAG: polymerase sigma-70 factor, subfamily [Candidatus Sumerlaeota bacterium]|nr:polymerase sigma-70 factor, subfamily [Candidatus Sumerlaeota bacterium]
MALADVPADLIARCQQEEPGAFDELFAAIQQDVFRWTYSLVRNEENAQEISQDCLVRIFRHLPRLKDPERFGSWASRLIVNQVNTWRVKERRTRLESLNDAREVDNDALPLQGAGPPSPRAAASRSEILRHVNRAITELPPRQRTAVLLFDVKGWSIRQIAEDLGCSEGAVKFNIFQGRRKLREILGEYVDEDGNAIYSAAD